MVDKTNAKHRNNYVFKKKYEKRKKPMENSIGI